MTVVIKFLPHKMAFQVYKPTTIKNEQGEDIECIAYALLFNDRASFDKMAADINAAWDVFEGKKS